MDYGVSVGFHRASEYKIGVVDNIILSPWWGWHILQQSWNYWYRSTPFTIVYYSHLINSIQNKWFQYHLWNFFYTLCLIINLFHTPFIGDALWVNNYAWVIRRATGMPLIPCRRNMIKSRFYFLQLFFLKSGSKVSSPWLYKALNISCFYDFY